VAIIKIKIKNYKTKRIQQLGLTTSTFGWFCHSHNGCLPWIGLASKNLIHPPLTKLVRGVLRNYSHRMVFNGHQPKGHSGKSSSSGPGFFSMTYFLASMITKSSALFTLIWRSAFNEGGFKSVLAGLEYFFLMSSNLVYRFVIDKVLVGKKVGYLQ